MTASRHRLVVCAAAAILWIVLGIFLRPDLGWGGFVYFPDYSVAVEPGGPAEIAGLANGDRMISVEGIPVEELPLYSRWPTYLAPLVGDTRRIVADRDGERIIANVQYGSRGTNRLALGAGLIVSSFLVSGLWAFFAVGTSHSRRLANIGVTAAVAGAAVAGPYLGTWDGVASHIQFLGMMLWTLLIFRFFLFFPTEKPICRNRLVTGISCGIWALFVPLMIAELVLHPALYHTFGWPGSLVMLGYCILAIAAAAHTVFTTPRDVLRESGMSLIIVGLLVAVIPSVIGLVDRAFLPRLAIPGSAYFPLSLAAVPVFMALAVRRNALAT